MKLHSRIVIVFGMLGAALSPATARYHHHYRHHHHRLASASYDEGNYYTAVSGHRVHGPMRSRDRPAGATARCGDGSWSFSESHRGTCSHHGGVASWL